MLCLIIYAFLYLDLTVSSKYSNLLHQGGKVVRGLRNAKGGDWGYRYEALHRQEGVKISANFALRNY